MATSTRPLPLWALGALLAVTLGLTTGCRGNKSASPPVHLNPNMDNQQYYEAQEPNPWFPDGRAMRPVVAGTVARGHLKADDHLHLGRGADGRLVDELPAGVTLDAALLDRGQARYAIYCTPCHAGSGYGDGVVMQKGFAVPAPSFHDPRLAAMPLGYFFDVITHGKGTMQPYAAQIPVRDRWAIAAWVRVLQVSQRADRADIPKDKLDSLEAGGAQ